MPGGADDQSAPHGVECRASRTVYANPWVRVSEDDLVRPDGTSATYAVVHAPDFAVVIPFDGERFHLVEQYRYPVGRRAWEFPQGTVHGLAEDHSEIQLRELELRDLEPRQIAPRDIAVQELAEETGLRAADLTCLGYLHEDYGRSPTGFHAWLATGLTVGSPDREPEEQDMRCAAFTEDEVWAMIDDGRITDATSVAALALLIRWRARSASSLQRIE